MPRNKLQRMSSSAQEKFWKSPDLVDQLVRFLGAHSASNLAQVHPLTVKILESAPVWSKLVKRTCHYNSTKPVDYPFPSHAWFREAHHQQRPKVQHFAKILQKMKKARLSQLELLDTICERCPPLQEAGDGRTNLIQVSCPRHISHLVSPLGFLLLEEVEQALSSAKQEVERVSVDFLDDYLVSVSSAGNDVEFEGETKLCLQRQERC